MSAMFMHVLRRGAPDEKSGQAPRNDAIFLKRFTMV